jgi:hypothetical protein
MTHLLLSMLTVIAFWLAFSGLKLTVNAAFMYKKRVTIRRKMFRARKLAREKYFKRLFLAE